MTSHTFGIRCEHHPECALLILNIKWVVQCRLWWRYHYYYVHSDHLERLCKFNLLARNACIVLVIITIKSYCSFEHKDTGTGPQKSTKIKRRITLDKLHESPTMYLLKYQNEKHT